MGLFNMNQPQNQRPMIKDEFTDMLKKRMSIAVVPFVIGAVVLVVALDQRVQEPSTKIALLLVGLVLFVLGFGFFVRYARDLKNYSILKWEEEEAKKAEAKKAAAGTAAEEPKAAKKPAANRPRTMAEKAASVSKLED